MSHKSSGLKEQDGDLPVTGSGIWVRLCGSSSSGHLMRLHSRHPLGLQSSQGSTAEEPFPSSYMGQLAEFSSLLAVGCRPLVVLCHTDLSIGQLTSWLLAPLERASKRTGESAGKMEHPAGQESQFSNLMLK